MWWFKKRKTLIIGVVLIVLVEFIGSHQSLFGGGGTAVAADPLGSLGDGGASSGKAFRIKRDQAGGGGQADGASSSDKSDLKGADGGGQKVNGSSSKGPSGATTPSSTTKGVKEQTLFIPDRSPANVSTAQITNQSEEDDDDVPAKRPGQGDFDEKAVQRAIIVISGIAVIVVAYLGIKFVLIKRRKVIKRYGRVEASEMDLLDEVEDEEDSDEEEELFDINQQRRS